MSGYVKTSYVTKTKNCGAFIGAYWFDSNGVYQLKWSNFLNGNNNWKRLSTTFTVPADSSSTNIIIRVSFYEESGTAYFDGLQLELGTTANTYNMLQNGDFAATGQIPTGWTGINCTTSDTTVTVADADHSSNLNTTALKITGAASKDAKLMQSVNVNGKAGDSYVVSGWAKAVCSSNGEFTDRLEDVFTQCSSNLKIYGSESSYAQVYAKDWGITFIIRIELANDINNDGVIDIRDLSAEAQAYGLNANDSLYQARIDQNKDNIIDVYDLVAISKDIK